MELNTPVEPGHQPGVAPPGEGLLPRIEEMTSQETLLSERLPFRIRIARRQEDLEKAVSIRHAAYGRHLPEVAALLEKAEPYDLEAGVDVLLAESKLDGSPLGSMRIQTNRYRRLTLEDSRELPSWLQGKSQAEATRLGVTADRLGRLVKTALFKAYYQYCLLEDIDWMVITARSPLDRQYEALLFQDAHLGGGFTPMRHVGNIPHRIMAFDVLGAERNWREARHPLYGFVFLTSHADIDRRGAAQISDRRGSAQHSDRRGAADFADRRVTARPADRRGSARAADRRGTPRPTDRRGTARRSLADRRGTARRSLAERRHPPLTGAADY